jgi:hypothetical protein
MIHSGRHRMKTHGGIPQGSTNNLSGRLALYLQWKENVADDQWDDQSSNGNNVTQGTAGDQAALTADGALLFVSGEADHYDLTSTITMSAEEGFVVWVVINLTATSANQVLLGLSGANDHWFEFKANADSIRCFVGSSSATTISPGDGAQNHFSAGEKMLVTLEREAGGTGNFTIWKNGVILAQDSQAADSGEATFDAIGQRGTTRYLNSTVYDVAVTEAAGATRDHIKRINSYLCAKHGISETL